MKFECPSCAKKYSLPDEKVPAGKDFKVKCKKCGEIIVLRGPEPDASAPEEPAQEQGGAGGPFDAAPPQQDAPPAGDDGMAPDEQPTRVFDYSRMGADGLPEEDAGPEDFASAQAGAFQPPAQEEQQPQAAAPAAAAAPVAAPPADDLEWHIAVDGDQMGPYDSAQIQEMLAAGQITDETYIWRDGFDDWLPLRDVPEFGAGGEAQPAAAAAPAPGPSADSPFAIGGGGGQSQDIFAAAGSEGPSESPFAAPSEGGGGGVSTSLGAEPQSPRVEATDLKGARHENSVLFSLSSLQALASSSKDPAPGGGGLGAPGAAGSASTEGGSGLIDIKSLTAGAGVSSGDAKPSDDIISMGGQGLGSSMGVPSLLQPVKKEPSKLPYILGGVGGLVVVASLVVVVVLLVSNKNRPESNLDEEALRQQILAELMEKGIGKEKAEEMAAAQAAEQVAEAEEGEGGEEAGSEDEGGEKVASAGGSKKGGGRKPGKKKGSGGGSDEDSGGSGGSSPTPPKDTGSKPKSGSIEDDLLAALKGKPKIKKDDGGSSKPSPSPSPAPTKSLPEKPTKSDVISALKKVTPKVKSCGKGETGVATVSINIAGATGKVTSASVVSGPFKGKPQAGCIVGAVKKARFPKFQQKKFSVSYPFVIK